MKRELAPCVATETIQVKRYGTSQAGVVAVASMARSKWRQSVESQQTSFGFKFIRISFNLLHVEVKPTESITS